MDYKRKYNNALERAKSFKTSELRDVAEYIFPELKESEYFKNTDDAYQWLSEITDGKIKTKKDVEDFNDSISERNPDEFIYVHEYLIIDN